MDIMEICIIVAVIVLVVFLVIGLVKRTFWMCIVAVVIALLLGFTQPDKLGEVRDSIIIMFDGALEPMKDKNYSDIAQDAGIIDKDKLDEIDQMPSDILDIDGK